MSIKQRIDEIDWKRSAVQAEVNLRIGPGFDSFNKPGWWPYLSWEGSWNHRETRRSTFLWSYFNLMICGLFIGGGLYIGKKAKESTTF